MFRWSVQIVRSMNRLANDAKLSKHEQTSAQPAKRVRATGREKLPPSPGAGLNRIVKYDGFERRIWVGAHELEQSHPGRIGTAQLLLTIARANVPVFHNIENIAGVDRLAIGMIGMTGYGTNKVSPNQLPVLQARVFCCRTCDNSIRHYVHREPPGWANGGSGVLLRLDPGTQARSGADIAQQ